MERTLRASTIDFQSTTALVAALALFGGAFLIFNTLAMTVTERAREVGLLRAAGASRGQVNRLILSQALVIGLAWNPEECGGRRRHHSILRPATVITASTH